MTTVQDLRDARKERILSVVAMNDGLFDTSLASRTGILCRDDLRPLLVELAAGGKIATSADLAGHEVADADRWVDGEPPLWVSLAPPAPVPSPTPSLEDRIVTALAEAGFDGLGEEDLEDIVRRDVEADLGEEVAKIMPSSHIARGVAALLSRGLIHGREHPVCGGETLTLSHAEWARRIVAEIEAYLDGTPIEDVDRGHLRALTERLLAGTEA